MKKQSYDLVFGLLHLVDSPNKEACLELLEDEKKRFMTSLGSTANHHDWEGGYIGHIAEVMNLASRLYETMVQIRPLDFSLSDALLVLYLHDLEKPWKYVDGIKFPTKADRHKFRLEMIEEYGIKLTEEQHNGLKYVEGELDDYSSKRRVMNPLAAFCHMCDVASARIWFDHPQESE